MTVTVELLTTQDVFERLHKLADGKRANVSVDRDELRQLLMDHSVMLANLHSSTSFKVIEPLPKRIRPRLR